jgi:hypothetical protein
VSGKREYLDYLKDILSAARKARAVVGVYDSVLEAYLKAMEQYGPGAFMIQPCQPGPDAYTVTISSTRVSLCPALQEAKCTWQFWLLSFRYPRPFSQMPAHSNIAAVGVTRRKTLSPVFLP